MNENKNEENGSDFADYVDSEVKISSNNIQNLYKE